MGKLIPHPVAGLFPDLSPADFAALVDDIRENGVKVPIVVHRGRILDGRHRYRACQQLRKPCPTTEWDGRDPWLEVQSRNLVRRHLTKDQICAIRMLAAQRFPELAAPIAAARAEAQQRKAQAKNQPRGIKALLRSPSPDRERESADVIGAQIGVSGTTVKRVDRLMRDAPELVPKVAAGELSVKKALGQIQTKRSQQPQEAPPDAEAFLVEAALRRLRQVVKSEWVEWPRAHRRQFLWALHQQSARLTSGIQIDHWCSRRGHAGAPRSGRGLILPIVSARSCRHGKVRWPGQGYSGVRNGQDWHLRRQILTEISKLTSTMTHRMVMAQSAAENLPTARGATIMRGQEDSMGGTRIPCLKIVVAVAAALLLPISAAGQQVTSGIAGAVRDISGAVLPGVTVEATSPALIEKVRTGITDSEGTVQHRQPPAGHVRRQLHAARIQHGAARWRRAAWRVHGDSERARCRSARSRKRLP